MVWQDCWSTSQARSFPYYVHIYTALRESTGKLPICVLEEGNLLFINQMVEMLQGESREGEGEGEGGKGNVQNRQ